MPPHRTDNHRYNHHNRYYHAKHSRRIFEDDVFREMLLEGGRDDGIMQGERRACAGIF
jgi:hypothetical protein